MKHGPRERQAEQGEHREHDRELASWSSGRRRFASAIACSNAYGF